MNKFIICLCISFLGISCSAQIKEKTMKMNKNFSVEIIRYNIPSEEFENFEKAYDKAGELLLESPYCLGYNILHGDDEPNHYIVTIYWKSKEEHLNGFRRSEQFPSFLNLVKPFYNNIEEMKHYKKIRKEWKKG